MWGKWNWQYAAILLVCKLGNFYRSWSIIHVGCDEQCGKNYSKFSFLSLNVHIIIYTCKCTCTGIWQKRLSFFFSIWFVFNILGVIWSKWLELFRITWIKPPARWPRHVNLLCQAFNTLSVNWPIGDITHISNCSHGISFQNNAIHFLPFSLHFICLDKTTGLWTLYSVKTQTSWCQWQCLKKNMKIKKNYLYSIRI